jgi:hypothetical protein
LVDSVESMMMHGLGQAIPMIYSVILSLNSPDIYWDCACKSSKIASFHILYSSSFLILLLFWRHITTEVDTLSFNITNQFITTYYYSVTEFVRILVQISF